MNLNYPCCISGIFKHGHDWRGGGAVKERAWTGAARRRPSQLRPQLEEARASSPQQD